MNGIETELDSVRKFRKIGILYSEGKVFTLLTLWVSNTGPSVPCIHHLDPKIKDNSDRGFRYEYW